MSDNPKIQDTPAVFSEAELALAKDAEQRSTHGFAGSQVMRSFPEGVEVQGRAAGLCSPAPNNRPPVSGYAVDSPVAPVVVHVDQKNVGQGGYPGDTRKRAADPVFPNQPAPREVVHQTPISGRTPAPCSPASFDAEDVGA